MSFKPAKERSLVLKRGEVVDSFIQHCRSNYPHHLEEAYKNTLQSVQQLTELYRIHPSCMWRTTQVAESNEQFRFLRQVQSLDIAECDPPRIPMASPHVQSSGLLEQ